MPSKDPDRLLMNRAIHQTIINRQDNTTRQKVYQKIQEEYEDLFDDWDFVFSEATNAYYNYIPEIKTVGPDKHIDAIKVEADDASEARENARTQLRTLRDTLFNLDEMKENCMHAAISKLGYKVKWRDVLEVFDQAVHEVPIHTNEKISPRPFYEAGYYLLKYFMRNIGMVSLYEPISKNEKSQKKINTIEWLSEQFVLISGIERLLERI